MGDLFSHSPDGAGDLLGQVDPDEGAGYWDDAAAFPTVYFV